MVAIIPKYAKWNPALFSFYFFVVASAVAGLTTPLTNTLNAVGRIKTTLFFMIIWTVLTWALSIIGLKLFGFDGFSIALAIISFTIVWVVYEVKKTVSFAFFAQIQSAACGIAIQGVWYAVVLAYVPHSVVWLAAVGFVGVILYAATVFVIDRSKIVGFIRSLRGLP